MHTLGHEPYRFGKPLGLVDAFALLTLASAAGTTLVMLGAVVTSWLSSG